MIARKIIRPVLEWVLNDENRLMRISPEQREELDPARTISFILLHIACLSVFVTGYSHIALLIAILAYLSRMFFITAFYHRYFSHRSYRVSRPLQFLMAVLGCTAGQRGPLWWTSHHRNHHATSDSAHDPHTPRKGFWNSHVLWFLRRDKFIIEKRYINDLLRYPELVWLEKFDWLPFVLFGLGSYLLGDTLAMYYPGLETSGAQVFAWSFVVSTVVLYHATYTINSLAHRFGHQRFRTNDDSRNNWWLALLTLGEGWHNNHHRYPASARQGFFWWELDITYLLLQALKKTGLVTDLRPVPASVLAEAESTAQGGRA